MSCIGGGPASISAGQKPRATKYEPQNLPATQTCQVSAGRPACIFMPGQPKPPKHTYPTKICDVWGAMFQPHPPIFHVRPCNPHACPMTHP